MHEDSFQLLTEFCADHPEILKCIHYKQIATYDEPVPILDPVALEMFRVWEIHREYIKAQSTLLGRLLWWLRSVWMMSPFRRVNLFPGVVFPRFWRPL